MGPAGVNSSQRVDQWLWFARITKSRTLAQDLISRGKVRLNREKIDKPSTLVKPGGLVVFSNCSLDPLEGETVVSRILADRPDVERVPVDPSEWPGLEVAVTPEGALRTTPAMLPLEAPFASGLDGFYAAVLRRLR